MARVDRLVLRASRTVAFANLMTSAADLAPFVVSVAAAISACAGRVPVKVYSYAQGARSVKTPVTRTTTVETYPVRRTRNMQIKVLDRRRNQ